MKALNKLGGKHGVGRVDMVENRYVGMKSRGVYETPGGAILHFAHRQMESAHDGPRSHAPARLAHPEIRRAGLLRLLVCARTRWRCRRYVTESQKNVTGTVRVKLYKGNIMVAGRKSPVSLYNPHIATMEADPTKAYNQDDATGFIRLNALRLRTRAAGVEEGEGEVTPFFKLVAVAKQLAGRGASATIGAEVPIELTSPRAERSVMRWPDFAASCSCCSWVGLSCANPLPHRTNRSPL